LSDQQVALKTHDNEMEDGLTRYLATRHMYVCEMVASGEVSFEGEETKRNVADVLTEPLGGGDVSRLQTTGDSRHNQTRYNEFYAITNAPTETNLAP
jgi:hypothetical protein